MCILHHSNRLCVITLADTHPILKFNKTVDKVNFQIDSKTFRLDNKVSGKNKRGAQYLKEGSALCHVTCTDQSMYTLVPCIRGSLVEVNETLINEPNLLTQSPSTRGYIAIIQTGLNDHQKQIDTLLSREQFEREVTKRDQGITTDSVQVELQENCKQDDVESNTSSNSCNVNNVISAPMKQDDCSEEDIVPHKVQKLQDEEHPAVASQT